MPRLEPASPTILQGDCLTLVPTLDRKSVDLVYMDPPFNTGRAQRSEAGAFADSWRTAASYVEFIQPRVAACAQALKPCGAILVHCDWRTSHHIRIILDELLGANAFVNHLIWRYGLGGSSPRRFARKHDDILFYVKGDDYYFDPPRVPATSERLNGQTKKATDVLDIPAINNMARERTGYPTQKPLALLRLLINACCRPAGVVLDPFCGSGTTLVAAIESGRSAVGFDVSAAAIRLSESRCRAQLATA